MSDEAPAVATTDAAKPGLLDRIPWWTSPAILLGVPALIWILTLINPTTFYDNFVWKYIWGPIYADANGLSSAERGGIIVTPQYNPVNTTAWALLLAVCMVGATQIVNGLKQKMDTAMVVGATGWVLAGSMWRVLEDTGLIMTPIRYVFITPPIYLLFAAFGIMSFVFGYFLVRVAENQGTGAALARVWMFLGGVSVVYLILWLTEWSQLVEFVNPVTFALMAAVTFFTLRAVVQVRGSLKATDVLIVLSLFPLLVSIAYIVLFLDAPWASQGDNALPWSAWAAPLFAAGVAGLFYALGGLKNWAEKDWAKALRHPVNLLIIFSQTLDGFATSLGLDLAGYVEKHVVSDWVIRTSEAIWGAIGWGFAEAHPTFFGFLPLKIFLGVLIVMAIDVWSKEDVKRYPTLIGFVKFAVIMVGIGPGVRDFGRLALGV